MYFCRMTSIYKSVRTKTQAFVLVAILGLIPVHAQSQQVVLNTRGERIVVYPDGSWRYYERADSILINKTLLKKDALPSNEKDPANFEKSSVNPKADSDISALASRFAERMTLETNAARRALTVTVEEKFDAEARVNQAQNNRKHVEPDILAKLDEDYESRTASVKSAKAYLKWMEKMDAAARDMLALPIQKKPKTLNKLIAEYDAYVAKPGIEVVQKEAQSVEPPKTLEGNKKITSTAKSSNPPKVTPTNSTAESNVKVYQRAPVPCAIAQPNGANASRSIKAVESQLLFTYTDEDLRPYFRQQELVTCYASLMQIENNLYLSLEFQIASPDARRNFGILENNSMLRLKSIDGTFINLFNSSADQGKIDPYTGNTIYTGNYLIDRESEKALSKNELDKLRVVWSTGFEDYDIVNLDFLINQFSCLRKQ